MPELPFLDKDSNQKTEVPKFCKYQEQGARIPECNILFFVVPGPARLMTIFFLSHNSGSHYAFILRFRGTVSLKESKAIQLIKKLPFVMETRKFRNMNTVASYFIHSPFSEPSVYVRVSQEVLQIKTLIFFFAERISRATWVPRASVVMPYPSWPPQGAA